MILTLFDAEFSGEQLEKRYILKCVVTDLGEKIA